MKARATNRMTLKEKGLGHDHLASHESIFIEYYDWLIRWGHQMTRGTNVDAADLVQELYIRFVRTSPYLSNEDHIRAYLYKALKSTFLSCKLKRRDLSSRPGVIDFASIEFAMTSTDRTKLLYVRSDLSRICEYVRIRRKTSKVATAFSLRFFLDYLPTEVMALLQVNRASVDALLQTARLEARAFLERPSVLHFLDRTENKPQAFPPYLPEQSDALFAELQRRIFSEREGECLSSVQIAERYRSPSCATVSTAEATHLGSCRRCLSSAAKVLGIPNLSLLSHQLSSLPLQRFGHPP